ncbi:MAG: hypothetical protein WC528_02690 [Patescibacteria group bacterium]
MTLIGPVFKVGEKVDWADPSVTIAHEDGQGPFIVLAVESNDRHFSRGSHSQDKSKDLRQQLVNDRGRGALPSQWISIETMGGKLLRNKDGKPAKYASAYFKKMDKEGSD